MPNLWISQIEFKPAGPLTFRRMPSGILHIMSYPFLPPTTMSGFLRRLMDIAGGQDWPGYGPQWYYGPASKEFTWTLDHRYRPLGAFPPPDRWSIHKSRRHGPKDFSHVEFSQILRIPNPKKRKDYQLHHWDYLFCEGLSGWVAARTREDLDELAKIEKFGGKVGKEGYLWIAKVHQPQELAPAHGEFKPMGLLTPPARPQSGQFYYIYGHHWNKEYLWANGEKGGVDGYFHVSAWWQADLVIGDYWQVEPGVGFDAPSVEAFLKGDVEPLCPNAAGQERAGGQT